MAGYARVKRRVAEILDIPSEPGDTLGRWFDRFIVTLILLNAGLIVFESVGDNAVRYEAFLDSFDVLSLAIFAAEYVLRVWSITAKPAYADPVWGRLRFMATPFAIIDLLAIVPIFLVGVDLRFVRVLRLLRLLKLTKYDDSFRILTNVLRKNRDELLMSLSLVLLALLVVSSLMYYAERDAQPEKFTSIPQAMYWGIIALTTTGYGDIVPVTAWGKLLAGVTGILGVASIALPVGILAGGFVEELKSRKSAPPAATACPHCGHLLSAK